MKNQDNTRRDFLKTSALAVAGTAVLTSGVYAAGEDTIKVGVVGCGGRGSGAAENVLSAAKGVKVVAVGDYFQNKADALRARVSKFAKNRDIQELGNSVDLPQERCFSGLDAYKKVIASDVNYIILATPPGFRPMHLQAAVDAGKHVFTEKPVATDAPGIRQVLNVYELATQKKLNIAAGTQRRHEKGYLELMKRVREDKVIGDIRTARCYWNGGFIWFRPRKDGMSDLDYRINNWYHFGWLCGDHIAEQHVHNIDVVNWALGAHPIKAVAMGGRVREYSDPNVHGNIFNFFSVDFEYPEGIHVHSMCRQINGCDRNVSETLVGSKGETFTKSGQYKINGENLLSRKEAQAATNPYVQEHTDLIEAIRTGNNLNELKNVAESTMSSLLGRMSAYTGKPLTWDQAINSKQELIPKDLSPEMTLQTLPLAVPGKTEFI